MPLIVKFYKLCSSAFASPYHVGVTDRLHFVDVQVDQRGVEHHLHVVENLGEFERRGGLDEVGEPVEVPEEDGHTIEHFRHDRDTQLQLLHYGPVCQGNKIPL